MLRPLFFLLAILFLSGCAGPPDYVYRYRRGKTATLHGGVAAAPSQAPPRVRAAIAAGNRIAGHAYRYGGGHGRQVAPGYDCSGATSYILREAGLMRGSMPSNGFRHYGKKGEGDWISVYARKGHVFLVIAGLRYDTGWKRGPEGPGWTTQRRPTRGYVVRHPARY
ncbi:MAG TPA: peptidoglycan endopeptidase [Chthoniobacteraceae bacterium]|nr:peptidoglycan endopeptidase [Chthoniobacteraceae bacterium]